MSEAARAAGPAREGPIVPPHPALPSWVGDAVAALLIAAAAFVPFPGEEFRPDDWATTLLVISPALVLPLRRRWPLPVLATCLAVYAVTVAMGVLSPGVTLGVAVAMFAVANRSTRRRSILVGVVAAITVFLVSIPAVFDARIFQFVLAVAFATAAGDGARSHRAYIEAVTERAERAERTREAEARRRVTEERLRIARDLHDTVAHQIAVVSLNAGVASSSMTSNPERAREALGVVRHAARAVLGEIGELMAMLRADDPEGDGLNAAAPHSLASVPSLLEQFRAAGLDVRVRVDGDLEDVPANLGLVAYRVLQEALTNAHKHGADHRAHVLLDATGPALRIVVSNPLANPADRDDRTDAERARLPAGGSGMGLVGMRERVASVRGSLNSGPAAGGWKTEATLPRTTRSTP